MGHMSEGIFTEFAVHNMLCLLTHLSLASCKRGTLANSVDPDQMPQNAASDQGLHCLQKFLQNMVVIKTKQTPLYRK